MAYGPLRKLVLLEKKGWDFQPDAVLYETQAGESMFAAFDLAHGIARGNKLPYPEIESILKTAQITPDRAADDDYVRAHLLPQREAILRVAFERLAETCRKHGVPVFLVMIPDFGEPLAPRRAAPRVNALGAELGFELIDLQRMLRDMPSENALKLAPWDNHPNTRGHRLIADKIYSELRPKVPYRP